jgi:transposase
MINYTLNDEELKIIQQAMNHATHPEVRQRSTAIHLLHHQHKPGQVADMMAVSMGCIYQWHQRWREDGIDGLKNRPKSGRPPNADDNYCQLLEELLANEPSDYGYAFAFWTADRLREHLRQKTGITISYRRPKHDLTELQDPDAVDRAKELLEWVKKPLSTDSSSLSLWTKQP